MTAKAAALLHAWKVGKFTATMTLQRVEPGEAAVSAVIEWSPHVPQRLTAEEMEQYTSGRNCAIAALGLSALVVDV